MPFYPEHVLATVVEITKAKPAQAKPPRGLLVPREARQAFMIRWKTLMIKMLMKVSLRQRSGKGKAPRG